MKIKSIVQGRLAIEEAVNEFAAGVRVLNIQTHLASDQQIVAIVVYEETGVGHGD